MERNTIVQYLYTIVRLFDIRKLYKINYRNRNYKK